MMTKTILVAVDGSEPAFKAVDLASMLAGHSGASLHIVHVVPDHELPDGIRQWAAAEHVTNPPEWLYDQAVADRILDAAADRAADNGVPTVERITEHGDAAKIIVDVAKRRGAETIVMGTRGLSGLQGLFMGSVAHKVNHLAPCTVVTVR